MVHGIPHRETEGRRINPADGKPFCEVIDRAELRAVMILDQTDVDLVNEAKHPKAWVKIYGLGSRTLVSSVREVARRNLEDIPPALSNQFGGQVASKPDHGPERFILSPPSSKPPFQSTTQISPSNQVFEAPHESRLARQVLGGGSVHSLAKTFNFTL